MDAKVVCVSRGSDDVGNAFNQLDEKQVQLLYTKFPVGTGTFRRNKFIYIIFIGPECGVVKRGKCIAEINIFKNGLHGAAGFSTTDRSALTLPFVIQQMQKVFVADTGNFSLDKIQEEYKRCIKEQQFKMHHDLPLPTPAHLNNNDNSNDARRKPGPHPGSISPPSQDDDYEMPSLASSQMKNLVFEVDSNSRIVLNSLHQELGPLNWATFEANPLRLTLAGAGNGGLFELVRHLPDGKWLFGLFRITLGTANERHSRLIFFQWIGSKLRVVRQGPTTRIFPKMASILAPYEYEVYLVGSQDLHAQAIINKCRNAFSGMFGRNREVTEETLRELKTNLRPVTSTFTEEEYRAILAEERSKMDLNFDFIRPKKRHSHLQVPEQDQANRVNGSNDANNDKAGTRIFDTKETLDLINQSEGGLVWSIFEARA